MPNGKEPISFHCPKCGRFCAADARLAGRRAQCLNCGTSMVIPQRSGQTPKRTPEIPPPPLEGFFTVALKRNFLTLFRPVNLPYLLLLLFLVTLAYFLGFTDFSLVLPGFSILLPTCWFFLIFAGLFQVWYGMRIVSNACLGLVELPDLDSGGFFAFVWGLIRDSYLMLVAVLLSFLPLSLLSVLLESLGMAGGGLGRLVLLPGFLLFPVTLLLLANGTDLTRLFRYDLFLRLIRRHWKPYLLTSLISAAALISVTVGVKFLWIPGKTDPASMVLEYLYKLGTTLLLVFAFRVIGFFGCHYMRTLPELWSTD